MSTTSHGGPAFPQDYEHTKVVIQMQQTGEITAEQLLNYTRQLHGMTLRDYFAAKAMQAWFSDPEADFADPKMQERAANCSYRIADSMLKERQE